MTNEQILQKAIEKAVKNGFIEMNYKIQIHKKKIYIRPRPKKDIKQGLVVMLNKPLPGESKPFIFHDVEENRKEYKLMDLPKGYFVKMAFIKDGGK